MGKVLFILTPAPTTNGKFLRTDLKSFNFCKGVSMPVPSPVV